MSIMKRLPCCKIILLISYIFLFGCSSTDKMSAKELYNEAYSHYKNESFYRAKPKFEELIDRDPLNKYAVLAELHLAEIFYDERRYDEAIIHYEEFLRLSPKTKNAEYLLYMIGMCHYNLITTYDRDQTETILALETFKEYMEKYPDGEYKNEVISNANNAAEIKLRSEYSIGLFYYKMKEYGSAALRCERIIKKYNKGEHLEDSYLILARSLAKLVDKEKLSTVYYDYLARFPDGKYKSEISDLL